MKRVNIHEGIDSTLLILQNRLKAKPGFAEIQVVKHYGNLPLVECYAGQLNQVFMNILANAIDAIEEQRFQAMDAGHQKTCGEITVSTQVKNSEWITVTINDDGPGIPEAALAKLFDPFYTTKKVGAGTGLGLSISYQIIVEQHGGQLNCISAPGQGTQFIVDIPVRQGTKV